jgi:hypothetical protein
MAVAILRDNSPEYSNWFKGRNLTMEINEAAREHHATLRDPKLTEVLCWSERGGEHICLGPTSFVEQQPGNAGVKRMYSLVITDDKAPVPAQ